MNTDETVNNVFRLDESWGAWFKNDWRVLPFIGDICYPPVYNSLLCVLSTSSFPWVLAQFADEITDACSMMPPETSDEFFRLMLPNGFFGEGCFLITDASEKWGIISYNGDCFIIGGEADHIEALTQFLGGVDKLKAEFDTEMKKFSGFNFGEGAILNKLPELWRLGQPGHP